MKFVLPILIDNLLISRYFLTFASSEFIKCLSDFKPLAEAKILVSSAKERGDFCSKVKICRVI